MNTIKLKKRAVKLLRSLCEQDYDALMDGSSQACELSYRRGAQRLIFTVNWLAKNTGK